MLDYIDAMRFADLAQFRLLPHFSGDYVTWNPEISNQNSIVFVMKGLLPMFFNNIRSSPHKYIIITHLSDDPIDAATFRFKPKNVVKWFAENAVFNHPDLIPIPFGLENHKGICTEGHIGRFKFFRDNIERLRSIPKMTDRVYCNWSIGNNTSERSTILEKLNVDYDWDGGEGAMNTNDWIPFDKYYENLARYKFVIAPPGHGVDAQRQWECIYMGCIPIVKKHNIYKEYNELPMIQIEDWSEVTPELLESYVNDKKEYNYEKVTWTYWKQRVLDEFDKLNQMNYA